MKLLLPALCSVLLPSILATSFGSDSAVITLQDVSQGTKMSLTAGKSYRVYGVYAKSAISGNYADNVIIQGADKTQFTLKSLSTPKDNGNILDDTRILTAPITITDTNPDPPTGFAARIPFTVYIVSADTNASPVLSAQRASGHVNCNPQQSSSSCTVLSAEMEFELSKAGSTNSPQRLVTIAGYDATAADYTVLTVTEDAWDSSVLISGPIATIRNSNGEEEIISFYLETDKARFSSSSSPTPGASTAFISNGWLKVQESYHVDYHNDNVRQRRIDFGRDTQVSFTPVVSNYFPPGDSITLDCGKAVGPATQYDCGELAGSVTSDSCQTLTINVNSNGKTTVEGPRFMVKIDSGASAFSMVALLMVSIIAVMIR